MLESRRRRARTLYTPRGRVAARRFARVCYTEMDRKPLRLNADDLSREPRMFEL